MDSPDDFTVLVTKMKLIDDGVMYRASLKDTMRISTYISAYSQKSDIDALEKLKSLINNAIDECIYKCQKENS